MISVPHRALYATIEKLILQPFAKVRVFFDSHSADGMMRMMFDAAKAEELQERKVGYVGKINAEMILLMFLICISGKKSPGITL